MSSLVFIYPQNIEFSNTFEPQSISIYNPYEVPIHYHFQCTRPDAFSLSSSEGEILEKHSLDITVQLLDKTIEIEKFQVRISSLSGKGKILGEKIIKVTLNTDKDEGEEVAQQTLPKVDHFQELPSKSHDHSKAIEYTRPQTVNNTNPFSFLIYTAFIISSLVLMAPFEYDVNSYYRFFIVGTNYKIAAAYVLGLVTFAVLRKF